METSRLCRAVNIRTEPFDVYIGRAAPQRRLAESPWANHHTIGPGCTREQSIARFKADFAARLAADPYFRRDTLALAGKRLGCWCKPKACHGDVIAAWVNAGGSFEGD